MDLRSEDCKGRDGGEEGGRGEEVEVKRREGGEGEEGRKGSEG
jgi:hypothetical protein